MLYPMKAMCYPRNVNDTAVIPEVKAVSFSAVSNWLHCGEAYRLARIERVKRRPGVWFPAGTAVHAAVESYLLSTLIEEN